MHDRVVDRDDLAGIFQRAGHVDLVADGVANAVRDRGFPVAGRAVHQDRPARRHRGAEVVEKIIGQDQMAHRVDELLPGDLDVADRLALDLLGIDLERHGHRRRSIPTARARRARGPCPIRSAGSPSRRPSWRAACPSPPGAAGSRAMSTSSCVTGIGRQIALASSVTRSRFMRKIVLSRMSRIITGGTCISSSRRGAGGAITLVGSMFMGWSCRLELSSFPRIGANSPEQPDHRSSGLY
jgi:hypothetical protein